MLDYFCIFARRGFVLWTFQLTALKGSPIDALIQTCLLQVRANNRVDGLQADPTLFSPTVPLFTEVQVSRLCQFVVLRALSLA